MNPPEKLKYEQKNMRGQKIENNPTLSEIILVQELQASELTPEQLDSLKKYSKGLFTIYEFANLWGTIIDSQLNQAGYALGLTHLKEMYYVACEKFNLIAWDLGYKHHQILPSSLHPFEVAYLKSIVATNKPIVFFVPREVFSHPKSDVTRRELDWFINNAETGASQNVYFVFGLYYLLEEEIYNTTLPLYSVLRFKALVDLMSKLTEEDK